MTEKTHIESLMPEKKHSKIFFIQNRDEWKDYLVASGIKLSIGEPQDDEFPCLIVTETSREIPVNKVLPLEFMDTPVVYKRKIIDEIKTEIIEDVRKEFLNQASLTAKITDEVITHLVKKLFTHLNTEAKDAYKTKIEEDIEAFIEEMKVEIRDRVEDKISGVVRFFNIDIPDE
jgi:hypothetical protein